jgi:hypothetical protein
MARTQIKTPGIADGSITTAGIAANAVTAAQIATGAVGSDEIASGVLITGTLNGNASTVTNGVYTGSFPNNFSATGYQQFPGGFIIQWGRSSGQLGSNGGTQYQTFVIQFPNAVFSIQATPSDDVAPAGDKKDHWTTSSHSTSGFMLRSWFEGSGCAYSWVAFGF